MVKIRRIEESDVPAVKKLITGIMNGEFKEEQEALALHDLDRLMESYSHLGEAFFKQRSVLFEHIYGYSIKS